MFDFSKFNWKEATSNKNGKSSVGLFICFWYAASLIFLTVISGITYFIKWIDKNSINNILLFVGVQMPIVLTYLFGRSTIENTTKTTTTEIGNNDLNYKEIKE
jgi:hypothetical protein